VRQRDYSTNSQRSKPLDGKAGALDLIRCAAGICSFSHCKDRRMVSTAAMRPSVPSPRSPRNLRDRAAKSFGSFFGSRLISDYGAHTCIREHRCTVSHFDEPHLDQNAQIILIAGDPFNRLFLISLSTQRRATARSRSARAV